MIVVINKYKKPSVLEESVVVNIMRGSILGNPFKMNNENEREIVINRFASWLRNQYASGGEVKKELHRLAKESKNKNIYLECCCAPKACHGDFIKVAIENIAKKFY